MARPLKDTVDYFPHECDHRRTMFIIEQRYGNDGYTFWFKLLEQLGKTPGHYIDCSNDTTWEFLQAKTRQNNGFCDEILNLLAKVEAIDKELWTRHRVIWSQNFVDGVASVYINRKRTVPQKPFYDKKQVMAKVSTTNNKDGEGILQPINDKGKETKGKDIK